MFNPGDWYWRADDGRLFSSARLETVSESDPTYKEWFGSGTEYAPMLWPRDEAGNQTEAELFRSLAKLGVSGVPKREFTFLEFMDLFTPDEQLAIAGASMQNASIKLWYDRAVGATSIILDDPRTVAGVGVLHGIGLISQSRAGAVLAGRQPARAA